jgi:Alpha galactosidase C-terminal beta sandwich domain
VTPVDSVSQQFSHAVVFFNRNLEQKASVTVALGKLELTNEKGYLVQDLFTGQEYGTLLPSDTFSCTINPTGVVMIKATIAQAV